MNILGKLRVFKKEYEGKELYSTTISRKDENGNYENLYLSLQIPKDVVLENNSTINVTKGFLSFYKTKQGLSKIKAVVQEFTEEAATEPIQETMPNYYDSPTDYFGDGLPF